MNDKPMKEFIKFAVTIDPSVKDYIAKKFIRDADLRHAIAFFQWRLYYNKKRAKNVDMESMIEKSHGILEFK